MKFKHMNHQTEKIINEAIDMVNDEGVFSLDQINCLMKMIYMIGEAIEKESYCNKSSINM